jgi:hypothetical protein
MPHPIREKPNARFLFLVIPALVTSALAGALAEPTTPAAEQTTLFDFDATGTDTAWQNSRTPCRLAWEAPPAGLPADGGKAMKVSGEKGGFCYTRAGVLPAMAKVESVSFWLHFTPEDASKDQPVAIELQFIERDGKGKFWRRLDLVTPGWTRFVIPLRTMPCSEKRSPRWDRVEHLGIFLRGPATFWMDNFTLSTTPGLGPTWTPEQLCALAFPDAPAAQIASLSKPDFAILTDCDKLELPVLEKQLDALIVRLRKDLLVKETPWTQPVLIVFKDQTAYREFTVRFAKVLNVKPIPPASGGYTVQGIATSFWVPERGSLRPVFAHELTHSWLDRVFDLPSGLGDWLQEGIANYYQLEFSPQADFGKGLLAAMKRRPVSLKSLCSGGRLLENQYGQAATLMRMLLTQEPYASRFPKLLEAVRATGNTDLSQYVKPVFDTTFEAMQDDWINFCAKTYGPTAGPGP